jgi:CRP-like cAMP-binding protein
MIEEVALAWSHSYLADLPAPLTARLLAGAYPETVEPPEMILRGDSRQDLILIIDGLVRVYLRGRDGRQATVRYASHGEIIGLPPLFVDAMAVWGEGLTTVRLLRVSGRRFTMLAEREVTLAWATARYVAHQLSETTETLGADIFLPVRARVARHLLDMAQREPEGLVVRARHQHIADAIGSVREVVSRDMRRFVQEGIIARTEHGTVLLDSAELHRISFG